MNGANGCVNAGMCPYETNQISDTLTPPTQSNNIIQCLRTCILEMTFIAVLTTQPSCMSSHAGSMLSLASLSFCHIPVRDFCGAIVENCRVSLSYD